MSSRGKRFKTLTDEWVGEKLKTVINVKQRNTIYKWLINYILPEELNVLPDCFSAIAPNEKLLIHIL